MFAPLPPKFDTVRTGELCVEVHGWGDGLRRSWRDGKMQVLETLMDEIVDGLEAHIVGSRLRREARERGIAMSRTGSVIVRKAGAQEKAAQALGPSQMVIGAPGRPAAPLQTRKVERVEENQSSSSARKAARHS